MKRTLIGALGLIALCSSLILPSTGLGQVTQDAELDITCGTLSVDFFSAVNNAAQHPYNKVFTFEFLDVDTSFNHAFATGADTATGFTGPYQIPLADVASNNSSFFDNDYGISAIDHRTPVAGCGQDQGFILTVAATDFDNGTDTIAASNLFIVTTPHTSIRTFDETSSSAFVGKIVGNGTFNVGCLDDRDTNLGCLDLATSNTDIEAPFNVNMDTDGDEDITDETFQDPQGNTTYTQFTGNNLAGAVTILSNNAAVPPNNHYGRFTTWPMYYLQVPNTSSSGSYASTITYSIQSVS
ncbi:hypothetical protein GF340_03310 [Candidatus Peregrinibacteria bacterium]|nr:hypothetical protein [Candidatus Peregrinibacteria bacterium]